MNRYIYNQQGKRRLAKPGMRVQFTENVGIDSGKKGTISKKPLKETLGWYSSSDDTRFATVLLDNGSLVAMHYGSMRLIEE